MKNHPTKGGIIETHYLSKKSDADIKDKKEKTIKKKPGQQKM